MVLYPIWTLFCGVYHPYGFVFYRQLCNRNQQVFLFLLLLLQSVMRCLFSPICFQSAMNGTSKSMSRPKIAAPDEAFNTVWYVEQIAHDALSMNVSMSEVQLIWSCLFQKCTSSSLGLDGCAHIWHLLEDS